MYLSLSNSRSWLLLSVTSGCMLGLFLTHPESLNRMPSDWVGPVLIPAAITALFLPLLGALRDRFLSPRRAVAFFVFPLLLLVIDHLVDFRIPFAVLGPVFTIGFLIAYLFHKSLLSNYSFSIRCLIPGEGLALTLGISGLLLYGRQAIVEPAAFYAISYLAASLLALACMVFYLFLVGGREKEELASKGMMGELTGFLISHGSARDAKLLLLFLFFFSMGGILVFEKGMSYLGSQPFGGPWSSLEVSPVFLMVMTAWGGVSAGRFMKTFGLKRTLTLSMIILPALLFSLTTSTRGLQVTLNSIAMAFVLGLSYVTTQTLIAGLLPRLKAGQGFGYFTLTLLLGIVAGHWLNQQALPYAELILFFVGLVLLQMVSISRAVKLAGQEHLARESELIDGEWEWQEHGPGGLARHTSFSRLIRFLARSITEIFFGNPRIIGREHLQVEHGGILVANHPNTFLDPLLVTAVAPGKIHYWAKSTLWKLPILGSILDRLGAIPIYRRQDSHGENKPDNRTSMSIASRKLNDGAFVLIFPEGVSEVGLSLKPLKTGAARLGFQALADGDWDNEAPIIPIGIDYAEPALFRSRVTIRIGEPVYLKEFRPVYEEDPRAAVVQATERVSEELKDLLPHLDEPELEGLVHRIHDLYGERVLQILNEEDETAARLAISDAVNHYQKMDPDTVYLFNQRISAYFAELERLGTPENHPPIPVRDLFRFMLGMFSVASFGLITNWIPYRLTGRVVEWFTSSRVWVATAKIGVGGIVFSVYYLIIGLMLYLLAGPMLASLILLAIIVSAFMALGAIDRFAFRFSQIKTLWQAFWTQDTNEDLDRMKVSLVQDLERFRESYEFYQARDTTW